MVLEVRYSIDTEMPIFQMQRLEAAISATGIAFFLGKEVGPYLVERAKRRFRSEGDDVTGKWAPLMPATQAIREADTSITVGPDHPINHRTGELENWVTGTAFKVAGGNLAFPGKAPSGELISKIKTAQQGKASPRTVARPVLGINQADMVFITSRLFFHIESISTGASAVGI